MVQAAKLVSQNSNISSDHQNDNNDYKSSGNQKQPSNNVILVNYNKKDHQPVANINLLLSPQDSLPSLQKSFSEQQHRDNQLLSPISEKDSNKTHEKDTNNVFTIEESKESPTKHDMQSNAAESEFSGLSSIINQNMTEEDLYYLNGLTKQVEVTYRDLESVMGKKSNIVYCAMKLHLKKKPGVEASNVTSGGSSASSSHYSQSSIAYPVYLIIT